MKFKPYPKYSDSGVGWATKVPTHWRVLPLIAIAEECERANKGMVESNLLSLSYGAIVRKNINDNDGLLPESFETYQIVEPNDIVWRLTDLQNDKRSLRTAIVPERGIITFAYLATKPTHIVSPFLNYLLRAYDVTKVFYSMGGGLRQSIKFIDVKRLPIFTPPSDEQISIARYLDRETTKLDTLIVKQERLIELLQEKRQAMISHAVTKGLDPSVPMKDSGIEWLGTVPEHWRIDRLRRLCTRVTDGAHISPDLSSEDYPFVSTVDVSADGKIDRESCLRASASCYMYLVKTGCRPFIGDVLFSKDGTVGRTAVVDFDAEFVVASSLIILSPIVMLIRSKYLNYWLNNNLLSQSISLQLSGAALRRISVEKVRQIAVAVPPLAEQKSIEESLDRITNVLDTLICKSRRNIELMREHRTALISAAVTGKIDVREAA